MKNYELFYFRMIAAAEGLSLIALLFIAMPIKYIAGNPAMVKVLGSLHGILFLVYVYALISLISDRKWTKGTFFVGLLASSIPFGTFWFDLRYLAKANLSASQNQESDRDEAGSSY